MLQFEQFLRKYIPKSRINYIEMDTGKSANMFKSNYNCYAHYFLDSLYFAVAGRGKVESLRDCVPYDKLGEFDAEVDKFLAKMDPTDVTYRQPGLFKVQRYIEY